jgi:CHASE3 domain sensor protein
MTTKFKIIGGFVIMIILLAGMAGIGYNDIQKSSENFTNYRRQARINVATSDVLINLSQSVAKTYDFVTTRDSKAIAGAHKDLDELNEIADGAYAETHIDYRKQAFTDMKKTGGAAQGGGSVHPEKHHRTDEAVQRGCPPQL